jgi:structural maintenance of chromosome 2
MYSQFGKPGTMYDFEGIDIVELKERASQLEDSQKGLKKKVNPKVMNMIDKWVSFWALSMCSSC